MCCMVRESDHVIMNVCLSFGAAINIRLPHCWRGEIAIAMHNAMQCIMRAVRFGVLEVDANWGGQRVQIDRKGEHEGD